MSIEKIVKLLLVTCILTTFLGITLACNDNSPLSIEINTPEDGAALNTNLVKVKGIISNPKATVLINGQEAQIKDDGSFYTYLELEEGENIIKAVARLGSKSTEASVDVIFTPSLFVILSLPDNINDPFTGVPITVEGYVFPHEAAVTVKGNPVSVDEAGFFNTQINLHQGNNIIQAVATLDDQMDTDQWTILVENGIIGFPPGQGMGRYTEIDFIHSVQIGVDQLGVLNINAEIRKDIWKPGYISFYIFRVEAVYKENEIALPEGMTISIEPAEFKIYPNTVYSITLTIRTSSKTPPGEYYFLTTAKIEGSLTTKGWTKVTVTADGGFQLHVP